MTVKRRDGGAPPPFTPEALDVFKRLRRSRPGSDEWNELQFALYRVLRLRPWEGPPAVVHPDAPTPGWDATAQKRRWVELSAALRRRSRA